MRLFSILVHVLWLLSMFGYILICLDVFTNTYRPCSFTSNRYIESISHWQIVKQQIPIFFLSTRISYSSNRLFEPAQIIDMVKGLVVLGCAVPMCFMDISVVYHTVRAQAAIKLYMFFNMLEVSNKLFLVGNSSYFFRRYAIVYYLLSVKTHWMQSIGLPPNHDVNTVLENYFFG